jgi:hypothetical protein
MNDVGMDYWYGRLAQLSRDGGDEFVLTPAEWFQLRKQLGTAPSVMPSRLFGKPVRVSWESVIPCPHCGRLPSDPGEDPTQGEIIPRR